jgi:hypothetical protein
MFLTYDLLFVRPNEKEHDWRFFLPSLSLTLLGTAFLLFRIPQGSAYSTAVEITIPRIIMNLAYYVLIGLFALPSNYAFLDSIPLWQARPVLPSAALFVSATVIVTLGWVWLQERVWQIKNFHYRTLVFAFVWVLGALMPVILIVTERATFLLSIGIALGFSVLFAGAWEAVNRCHKRLRGVVAAALILYVGLNTCVLRYRSTWWEMSARANRTVLRQLEQRIAALPANTPVLLVNLPDHVGHAFAFRNTFPSAAQVLDYDRDIQSVLDSELAEIPAQQREDYIKSLRVESGAVVFWYQDGILVRR